MKKSKVRNVVAAGLIIAIMAMSATGCTAGTSGGSDSSADSDASKAATVGSVEFEYVTPDDLKGDDAQKQEAASDSQKSDDSASDSQKPDGSDSSDNGGAQDDPSGGAQDGSKSSDNSGAQGQPPQGEPPQGEPPEKPDGDSSSGQPPQGQPPEKPDSNSSNGSSGSSEGSDSSDSSGDSSNAGNGGAPGQPPDGAPSGSDSSSGSNSGNSGAPGQPPGGAPSGSDSSSGSNSGNGGAQGQPPGGAPGGGGADTATYDYTGEMNGAFTADGEQVTSDGEKIKATGKDQNAVLAENGGTAEITNATITKTGSDEDGDNCNFYGLNSSVLAAGEDSKVYISDSTIDSDSAGSNGIFATDSATVYAKKVGITTKEGGNSRGLDATYGGVIYSDDVTVSTEKDHCAAVATDRGGGYISVTNSTLNTAGSGSPVLYSTGDIEVDNVTGTASGSQIAGIEGMNRIIINNSSLSSTNDAISGSDPIKNGVILYQSTSGDADTASTDACEFEAIDSTLSTTITDGAMFYVTNTDAKVVLQNTNLDFDSSKVQLLNASGNDSNNWGTAGSNGGTVTLTAIEQTMSGDIYTDDISKAEVYLTEGSQWTGKTVDESSESKADSKDDNNSKDSKDSEDDNNSTGNSDSNNSSDSANSSDEKTDGTKSGQDNSAANTSVNIDGSSTWTVSGDCEVADLNVAEGGKIVDESGRTVTIKVGNETKVKGDSKYTITVNGKYTTEMEVPEGAQLNNKVLDRTEFDDHYETSTQFGTNGK